MLDLHSVASPELLIGFLAFVLVMLGVDLGLFHKRSHEIKFKESLIWTLIWVSLALSFCLGIYIKFGEQPALQFITGYLVEQALSVDNLFVFILVFSYFGVPVKYQHRVLFYGILGALVMRAGFIVMGAALIQRFHWILYIFGIILISSGVELFKEKPHKVKPDQNIIIRIFRYFIPVVSDFRGRNFLVREGGKLCATPLFIVLLSLEITDLVFAVDSIPAIFAITKDPFIVFTSNIFAIIGLRSLFFLLSASLQRLKYLNTGLAVVLIFIGAKMLCETLIEIPTLISLVIIVLILIVSVLASLRKG